MEPARVSSPQVDLEEFFNHEEEEEEEEEERTLINRSEEEEEEEEGGGERLIKDLKRKANSLSRDTRQANALGLEGGPPPLGNCSTRHDCLCLLRSAHQTHCRVEPTRVSPRWI